tara:strand:- start:572 stop:826 length:255 start_codon:yes stop_codon:yes gene_type:complete
MEVKKVINGGKLTGSYLSSWNNELQLTVVGGHEFNVKIGEEELRDLANRINERVESIDAERAEKLQAEIEAQAEEAAALEETDG